MVIYGRRINAFGLAICAMTFAGASPSFAAESQSVPNSCADLLPQVDAGDASKRALSADDLVRLRDIGSPDSSLLYEPSPLAVSPDGKHVAFVLNRADLATNSFCRGLVLASTAPGEAARLIDQGGDFIKSPAAIVRDLVTPGGFPATIVPKWSPDGLNLAYLKRVDGVTQVWLAAADGSGATQISHSLSDIEDVAWTPDGRSVLFKSRPSIRIAQMAIAHQAIEGYRYDSSFVPGGRNQPRVRGPIAEEYFKIDLPSGVSASDTIEGKRAFSPDLGAEIPAGSLNARSSLGAVAWSPPTAGNLWGPYHIEVREPAGQRILCETDVCTHALVGLWWSPSGSDLWFERTEGWGGGQIAFYSWRPGTDAAPHRVLLTTDAISGCQVIAGGLVCARDAATIPRHIVRIDMLTGHSIDLFISNPEVEKAIVSPVRRLTWKNVYGAEAFGDLVLPVDYQAGMKYPLIVVQYMNRGFLRGGTGDEFPVYLFSQRGYAVLAFNRVSRWSEMRGGSAVKTPEQAETFDTIKWMNRRNQASALVKGVETAIKTGMIDSRFIGLTGLSDGSSTAQYLLINTRLFAAASLAACCMEPISTMVNGGDAWAAQLQTFGYPNITQDYKRFWEPVSFQVSARKLTVPTLFNEADDEYPIALPSFEAVRQRGLPTELYVYPDEHHIIWQPSHRKSIYTRNLEWFDRWLKPNSSTASIAKSYRPYRTEDRLH